MSQPDSNVDEDPASPLPCWRVWLEIALVFGVFFLHGAWPTPNVNETGYVTKAQHFWNRDAFVQDFFCNTGDAHVVFYWAFGWLTTLGWSLDTTAWVGRIITWLMLAIAWRGLSYTVLPKSWLAVLSAELFILLTEHARMADEWIVGGVEAKGFAWAFVLWALQALVRERWNVAWLLLGVATSLHVVVGGWATVCLGVTWLASSQGRPLISAILPGLVCGLILALPGLWFAWKLNQGADWQTVAEANSIQVFQRLPHHLLPSTFQAGYVWRHLFLWGLFLFLCIVTPAPESTRRLYRYVGAGMFFALAAFALGWLAAVVPNLAATFLRFYWSRLSDILVPIGVTLVALQFIGGQLQFRENVARCMFVGLLVLSTFDLCMQTRHFPWLPEPWGHAAPRSDSLMVYGDWRDICHWVAEANHTSPDARFITPLNSMTFKWYTGRGEVATWKDMPQDARSIVEWWQRINELFATGSQNPNERWRASLAELGQQRTHELAKKYGAQYAIVEVVPGVPRMEQQPVYENLSYAVYSLDRQ